MSQPTKPRRLKASYERVASTYRLPKELLERVDAAAAAESLRRGRRFSANDLVNAAVVAYLGARDKARPSERGTGPDSWPQSLRDLMAHLSGGARIGLGDVTFTRK